MKLFEEVKDEKVIGEASVYYLYSKKAAQNIYKYNPNSKILIMLRAPTEVMYSLFYQRLQGGYENVATFEEALSLEKQRKRGKKNSQKTQY